MPGVCVGVLHSWHSLISSFGVWFVVLYSFVLACRCLFVCNLCPAVFMVCDYVLDLAGLFDLLCVWCELCYVVCHPSHVLSCGKGVEDFFVILICNVLCDVCVNELSIVGESVFLICGWYVYFF